MRRAWIAATFVAAGVVLVAVPVGGGAGDRSVPVGGLTALPGPEAPGPNLVQNAGFETKTDGALAGWGMTPDGDLWSLDTGRTGRALKLSGAHRQRTVPSVEQVVTLEPGLYTLEGWAKAQGLGASAARTGVRFCIDARPKVNWWQCTPVASGTTEWTHLRQPSIAVRERLPYRITAGAYGMPDGTAWIDDVSVTEVRKPPLDVYLLYPNFRGMLFDDRPQTVRAAVSMANAPAAGTRVRVSLVDERGGGVVQQREYAAAKAFTAELDAAALPAGAYLLRVQLVDNGTAGYRYPDYRIVKLPAKAREHLRFWYDESNTTYLGGKPAFVLGLYTTSGYSTTRSTYASGQDGWGNDRIGQAPVNMLINYHLGQAPVPALTTYMDDLVSRGIHYLQTVNFYYEDHAQYKSIAYPAAKDGEDALNRWVARTLSDHPGLAGFYTADERPADMVPKVFRQHRALSAAAPGTLNYGVLGDGWEHQAPLWRDALDVIGLDPYPITKARGSNDLAMVGEWTRIGQDAVKRSRPVWMVLQYFPFTAAGGWPTEQELRVMSWMAIVDGARGLFYWSYGMKGLAWEKDVRKREQKWAELVRVTKEIKALEPVLLAPDAAVVVRESSNGAIRTLGKRMPDGRRYLFAYNTKGTSVPVTWTLAAPAADVTNLDTGKPATRLEGTTLTDELGPWEIRRLQIR